MNLSLRKGQEGGEKANEKLGDKIKIKVYALLHELIQHNIVTKWFYILLLIIETAQYIWFMVHPRFDFLWTTDVANGMRKAIQYLQVDYIINQNNSTIFLACLYTVLAVELVFGVLIYYVIRSISNPNRKNSTILTYSIKAVSLFAVLMNTVLALPFFEVFVAAFYCNKDDYVHGDFECYQGIYLVHFVLAIFGAFAYIAYNLMFLPFFIDLNPWSDLPFAAPQSIVPFGKFLMKVFAPGYFIIDFKGSLDVQFSAIIGVYFLALLFFRWQALPYHNRLINRFVLICESVLLWAGGVLNIHAFLDSGGVDNIGLLFLVVGSPFIAATYVSICERRYDFFIRSDTKNFKKEEDMEMYMGVLIDLIENKHEPTSKVQLEGVLKYYTMNSKTENRANSMKLIQADLKEDTPEKELLWYEWLKDILDEGLEKFEESTTLHLLNAYLHQEKLSNRFKALYELLETDENKPQIQIEFAIFRYKNIIEEEIVEHDANNSENKGIDVNILVLFQNKFVEFQNHIEKSVNFHLDFWRELLEDNPDIQKLQSLSSKITRSVEEVAGNFDKICEINNNHTRMLKIYGNFLRNIVNDDAEGRKLIERAEYIEKTSLANKQFIDNERLKYGENSTTCIVTCSGNYSNLGTVTNINNEVLRILEWSKTEIIGQNINRLMPKIIGDAHDGFMKNYFESSEPVVMGQERIVFPINKGGYLVPCSLMIKILPTLDDGIRVVGFLKDLEGENISGKGHGLENEDNVHYIMYAGDNLAVCGISQSCHTSFGIPSSFMYGNASNNELTLDVLMPELTSFQDEDLKNPNGFTTVFDSTPLQQNYVMKDNDEESDDEEQEQDNVSATVKYKRTKIRAILIQDEKYKDISTVRVLKFVEALEDEMTTARKILPEMTANRNYDEVSKGQYDHHETGYNGNDDDNSDRNSDKPAAGAAGENAQANDKIKKLKDAKALISEKNVPKSIRFLQRVGVVALIGWLITACVNLAMSFSLHSEISEGISSTQTCYYRYDTMADINYNIRKLQLWATFLNTSASATITTQSNLIKADLAGLIDQMQALQFDVIKAEIKMEKRMSGSYAEPVVTVESLLSTTIKYDTSNLTDALFTYLSQASSVRNATLASFVTASDTQTTLKNFYYVRRNGLGSLRNESENTCGQFYSFYAISIQNFMEKFLILALVAMMIVVLTNSASLPIISSLHQTNKKVLSMFGYIPTDDINGLAIKCERYIRDYLEDRSERRDFSFESDENSQGSGAKSDRGNIDQNHSEPEEDQLIEDGDEDIHLYEVDEMGNPINNTRIQHKKRKTVTQDLTTPKGGRKPVSLPRNGQDVKLDANDEEEEDKEKVEEIHFTRSQKLLNSRKNQNKADIMKFIILSATYIAGSIIYFVYQNSAINNNKTSFNHLKLLSQSIPQIRYINVYTLEELAQNNLDTVYTYSDGVPAHTPVTFNSRQYFLSAVQKNEQEISTSSKEGFPGSFDTYKSISSAYSTGNLCEAYYRTDDDQADCEGVMDGLLGQGLKVAIDTIISNSIDIMSQFYASDRTYPTQVSFINSTTFNNSQNILEQIYPPLNYLLTSYTKGYKDYNDSMLNISRIWFSLVVFYLVFTGVFLYYPYMRRLRDDIWRTKGMLNMIPMELIYENENLSHLFTSDELTKAVQ